MNIINNPEIECGIFISSLSATRHLSMSAGNYNIQNSNYLTKQDLVATEKIIFNLERVMRKEIDEYEWGDERMWVMSQSDISYAEDLIYDIQLPEVPTKMLWDIMKKWQWFQNEYSQKEITMPLIMEAFNKVVESRDVFKKWENGSYYDIKINGITIRMVLEEADFMLTAKEYISQIDSLNEN